MNSAWYEGFPYDGPSLYLAGQQPDYSALHAVGQTSSSQLLDQALRCADEQQSSDCSCGSSPDRWTTRKRPATENNGEPR
ncbi:hypothetical protein HPB48_003638 [Haemaphysalis longicornis]|uniref:Uncharacterized protein n=1 Tax=Haemaphysalis longicornis TaxID=44386 RepID=A0A9J6FHY0_HAELO|nr:hypothetical protein HPB48_003638 [Haemaphysalis longicornis]